MTTAIYSYISGSNINILTRWIINIYTLCRYFRITIYSLSKVYS
nr:MAG TPA: hypothetical protein [Caudoviricetes sp.]